MTSERGNKKRQNSGKNLALGGDPVYVMAVFILAENGRLKKGIQMANEKVRYFHKGEWNGRNNEAENRTLPRPATHQRVPNERVVRVSAVEALAAQDDRNGDFVIREPTSQQTLESHVYVPFFSAAIVGSVILAAGSYLARRMGWDMMWVICAGAITFLLMFLWRTGAGDKVLWRIEQWVGKDLNEDGYTGEPAAPKTEVIINHVKKVGNGYDGPMVPTEQVQRMVLPMSEPEMLMVGFRLAAGWLYSRDTFTTESTISQTRYDNEILPAMRQQGLIVEEKGKPNQLTEKAKIMWGKFGPPMYPPPPQSNLVNPVTREEN